ncbi:MAG TPA: hypothetical protein VEJ86_04645 [Candidatus Binataceae bacterium]|nr:hypothetical protein [Candidatus Binataceae bacterium]
MKNATYEGVRLDAGVLGGEVAAARAQSIPWYVWCLAAAVTSDVFGGYWDISWHISIGRDTFWTPAHMAVYLAGVLAGIASGYTILTTTFGSSERLKGEGVSIWGFRGPLGCFVAAWGGIAMLTSAPFDNWWHNAYGLDVKIVSLPHSILALGELMIVVGALLLICAQLNRASGEQRENLDRLLLYVGGILVCGSALFALESTPMEFMHSSRFYRAVAEGFPLELLAISCVSQSRWPATTMAAIYTALFIAGLWIFPLFPAEPKLGPVYQHITSMVPLWFPVLVIVPALGLDLLRLRLGPSWGSLKAAVAAGAIYLLAFVLVQWPFADFLLSPAARNWVFGAAYFGYNDPANLTFDAYKFVRLDRTTGGFVEGMAVALIVAIGFSALGMALGNWLKKVQR